MATQAPFGEQRKMGAVEGGTWPLPFLLQEASPGPHTTCPPSPYTGASPNATAGRPTPGHCVHAQEYEFQNPHVFAHTCHTWCVLNAHPGSRSDAVKKGPQSSCCHSACFPCCLGLRSLASHTGIITSVKARIWLLSLSFPSFC